MTGKLKIVFIGDTHNKHNKLTIPECDILIHSGDWSMYGRKSETEHFAKWLNKQPAKHIVVTAANHEVEFEREYPQSLNWITDGCPRATVLIHESIEIEGIRIFGSPWTPAFGFGWAYNAGRDPVEASHTFKPFIGDLWKDIPLDTNILITHGPGVGTLDEALDYRSGKIQNVGCRELTNRITQLLDLKIHAFGHLHLNGGKSMELGGVNYINTAMCDDQYNATRKPVEILYV